MNPESVPTDGRLEAATLESEISMSVVTDDTRYRMPRRPSLLDRILNRNDDVTDEDRKKYCCGIINVEPVLVLLAISLGLLMTSQPLFTYWARCVELATVEDPNISNVTSMCASISAINNTELQDLVENDISSTRIWLQVAGSAPTLIVAPLVGAWSDRSGRKMPLIFSMSGFVVYSVFYMISTLTYETTNVYYWLFVSEAAMGLTGGASTMFATILAIVTDDCRHKLKAGSSSVPLRIGVASALQSFGSLLGTMAVSFFSVPAIVSIVGHSQSYIKCAFIQCIFVVAAFIYAIVFVKETHHPIPEQLTRGDYVSRADSDNSEVSTEGKMCAKPGSHLWPLCEVMCERRPGWTRLCLNLAIFFVFIEFLALDSGLLLLLVKRQPFAWSDSMFSIFSVVKGVCFSIGMVLGPLSLVKFNILGKDSLLIMIGTAAASLSFLMLSWAKTTEEVFATAVISFFTGCIAPGYRTFLPRMVPKEQTARLLTVVSIVMAFCPILSALIFNNIFNLTMDWWPGFSFFVGGIFQIMATVGQIFIHFLMRPQWKMDKELKEHRKRMGLQGGTDDGNIGNLGSDERSLSNTAVGSEINYIEDDRQPLIT